MIKSEYLESVFLNVPFDDPYKRIFHALIFAVYDCGLVARCALEENNGLNVRIDKIYKIISQCKYGIHDISRTEPDKVKKLPRFNMPLELGIFLGSKCFGRTKHKAKEGLILDKKPYRYQIFCSDIGGQDIRSHNNNRLDAILCVRAWIDSSQGINKPTLPGGHHIYSRYLQFRKELPVLCKNKKIKIRSLTFIDYSIFVIGWLHIHPN